MTLQAILIALTALGAPKSVAPDVAASIAQYARSPQEAAFLASWGRHESGYDERIIADRCKRWECDRGLAKGAFQLHRGAAGQDWELLPGNIDAQVRSAARMARWAMKTCAKSEHPIRGAFAVLGGVLHVACVCGHEWRVVDRRQSSGITALEQSCKGMAELIRVSAALGRVVEEARL